MANFKKGEKRSPKAGRRKGVPNKTTVLIKEALLESFNQLGGVNYLLMLAASEPKSYAMLLARIIPAELHAEISGSLTTVVLRNYTGIEWEEKAKAAVEAERLH